MSTPAGPGATAAIAPWQLEFLERSSALTDLTGLAPSVARVFLWLVVCEPPQQSAEQLRDALGLSAGAVSTATAILTSRGLVERITPTGERRFSYRMHPRGWERLTRFRLEATSHVREIFDAALVHAPQPQARLAGMRAMYAWFEDQLMQLLAEQSNPTTNGTE